MDGVVTLITFLIAVFVVFVVSLISAVGVSLLICGIHMRRSNENNRVDYYRQYISQIPVQILRSQDLR